MHGDHTVIGAGQRGREGEKWEREGKGKEKKIKWKGRKG